MKLKRFSGYMMAATALMAAAAPVAVRADDKDDGTTVQLTAEARRMVMQDRVMATLGFDATAKTAAAAQAEINTKMQEAQKIYSKVASVKATTGAYNVYKDYEPEPAPKKDGTPAWTPEEREKHVLWRASQELRLDGQKSDELLGLIATFQKQGFAVRGLNFYMSREAEDGVKDALMVEALQNIKARAENIKTALGMKTIRYARIELGDTNGGRPIPMMARAMKAEAFDAAAAMPQPVVEAGETEVVLNVTAEVKLK